MISWQSGALIGKDLEFFWKEVGSLWLVYIRKQEDNIEKSILTARIKHKKMAFYKNKNRVHSQKQLAHWAVDVTVEFYACSPPGFSGNQYIAGCSLIGSIGQQKKKKKKKRYQIF